MKSVSSFPRVWEILERFKTQCGRKGWKIYRDEDLVWTGREHHHFVWTQHFHPSTFQRVTTNPQCPIRQETSYRMVEDKRARTLSRSFHLVTVRYALISTMLFIQLSSPRCSSFRKRFARSLQRKGLRSLPWSGLCVCNRKRLLG